MRARDGRKVCARKWEARAANIATKNLGALRETDENEIVAVASREVERAAAWIERHGLDRSAVRACTYDEIVGAEDIDALYVPLPTTLHAEFVRKAAAAGKHVLCEKPAAVSSAELSEMLESMQERGLVWMDGVMFMHHPRLASIGAALPSLGRVTRILSGFSFNGGEGFENNIRMKKDCDPLGALGDLGWYCARFFLAVQAYSLPTSVTCIQNSASPDGVVTDLVCSVFFADGVSATFQCGFASARRQWVEVVGTEACLWLEDFVNPMRRDEATYSVRTLRRGADGRSSERSDVPTTVPGCQEREMFRTFARLVRSSTEEERAFWRDASFKTQRIMDACMASMARDGARVAIE